jgi:tetratricopeptide (TPR) repeat protein
MDGKFVLRANERTIRSMLAHTKVLAVTGCLGSGKTYFLKVCERVARSQPAWAVRLVDRQYDSIFKVLEGLASHLNTPKFDRARQAYIAEFREVDSDKWIEVLEALVPAIAQTAAQAAQVSGDPTLIIASLVGSTLLNQQMVERAAATIRQTAHRRRWGKILANQPLDYLFKELMQDLGSFERIILLLDDFELLRPFLEEWLIHVIEEKTPENVVWVIACWGDVANELKIDYSWKMGNFSDHELIQLAPYLKSEQITELQGPPVFALPVLVTEWMKGGQSYRGEWWPLVSHLANWLKAQFGKRTDAILEGLLRCAISPYLEEGIVIEILGVDGKELWKWIDESPLVEPCSFPGFEYKTCLDRTIRSALTHEFWRRNEKEYFQLHDQLKEYHKLLERNPRTRHHRIPRLYHEWCSSSQNEALGLALGQVLDSLGEETNLEYDEVHNTGFLLIQVASECPRTRPLLRWGRLLLNAAPMFREKEYEDEPNWLALYEFYDALCKEATYLLNKEHQVQAWFGRGRGNMDKGEYEEAIQDFEKILSIVPDDNETQDYLEQARKLANPESDK